MTLSAARRLTIGVVSLLLGGCDLLGGSAGPGGGGDAGPCLGEATNISTLQGSGDLSPHAGEVHTVRGVVVADFQESDELRGFFLQEESADTDGNPDTSDAIFVYEGRRQTELAAGDLVQVTGLVDEYQGRTQMKDLSQVVLCRSGVELPEETALLFPLPRGAHDLEALEGMRVVLPQSLTVTETHDLGRYGEIVVSHAEEEPFQFQGTEREAPGSAGLEARDSLQRRSRLIVDDASTRRAPTPVPHLEGVEPRTLRRGDSVAQPLRGVVDHAFESYRLEPTEAPRFERRPRPASPPDVGGDLVAVSFNLLNYFTTLDLDAEGGDDDPRGADSAAELARQQRKIVAALCALDADVVALQELENNGDLGERSAVATLVRALNERCSDTARGAYARVETGTTGRAGTIPPDAITVGLLYRPHTVEPIGRVAVLESGTFDGQSRPPVARTFRSRTVPEAPPITVVANHFKSKGCSDAEGRDLDQRDGQGCYNETRTRSARELARWLGTDPTGVGDVDSAHVLVLGDLNAYTQEDPIAALERAGWSNLLRERLAPTDRYTYVYHGSAGVIDHAFASRQLAGRVSGVGIWHVNADEPRALDYNDAVEDPGDSSSEANGDDSLYVADPFRSSDHDPVIVGIHLTG